MFAHTHQIWWFSLAVSLQLLIRQIYREAPEPEPEPEPVAEANLDSGASSDSEEDERGGAPPAPGRGGGGARQREDVGKFELMSSSLSAKGGAPACAQLLCRQSRISELAFFQSIFFFLVG